MKLNEILNAKEDEAGKEAQRKFDAVVYRPATRFSHESPEPPEKFYSHGITGDSVFCTVNAKSNFVSSLPKTRIWFRIKPGTRVVPDMRYAQTDEDDFSSVIDLIDEHPSVNGADVCVLRNIPLAWILYIEKITEKGAITVWSID